MEIEKIDNNPSLCMEVPASTSAAIITNENADISLTGNSMENGIMTIKLPNFYQEEIQVQPNEASNHSKISTSLSMPVYFLATTDAHFAKQTSSTTANGPQQNIVVASEERIDNFSRSMNAPLSYYSNVGANHPQILNFVSKPVADVNTSPQNVDKSSENQLSEDFIQSFVVGGNKKRQLTSTTDGSILAHKEKDSLSTGIDCSIQTTDLVEEHQDSLQKDDLNAIDLTLNSASLDKSNPMKANDESSQIKKTSVEAFTGTVEAFLNSQPILHMSCNVETEVSDHEGVTVAREIATQTIPMRKHTKKEPCKEQSQDDAVEQPAKPPEFKVILTTDELDVEPTASNNDDMFNYYRDDGKGLKCPRCALRFEDKDVLEIHIKCHRSFYDDKRYVCYICGVMQSHWLKMYTHLFTHGLKKPFHCDQCTYTCVSKSELLNHSFVHVETKVWLCPKCERSFKHQRNMKAHARNCIGVDQFGKSVRASSEIFKCNICHKELCSKRNLDKHMEIHRDLKPFVCNICGHATRLKESLLTHKRIHTGEKPFKCDSCNYSSSDKSALRRHKRKHNNDKPYACKFCDYRSIQKHCLDTHVHRKHTGEKFICGLCHYETYHRYGLNQHFKHQHREELEQSTEETCLVSVAPAAVVISNNEDLCMTE